MNREIGGGFFREAFGSANKVFAITIRMRAAIFGLDENKVFSVRDAAVTLLELVEPRIAGMKVREFGKT